jgi:hypothetical protein
MDTVLTEAQVEELYQWVDTVPLSRRKKNLPRDFSDAVLMAEVVHHFYPRLVDLHNYDQGLRVDTKVYNWTTLNRKVLKGLNLELDTETITRLANAWPGVIDGVLWKLKQVVAARARQKEAPYFEDAELPDLAQMEPQQPAINQKLLLEKIQECEEQAEYIAALEAKIAKLEELMRLKDAKIAKLTAGAKKSTR